MDRLGVTVPEQLERQTKWLTEHWLWLLDTSVLPSLPALPSALDVGSGPGLVAESISSRLNITCLDSDLASVQGCRSRGLKAVRGDAHYLPFPDRSFDMAYCSFALLWFRDPLKAVNEMLRVSRSWVLLLAEPDHGGRIDHPEGLLPLKEIILNGMKQEGADPLMGRKLRSLCSALDMDADIGIHPGAWSLRRMRKEAEGEWDWISRTVGGTAHLETLRREWDRALEQGTLFYHVPTFYAIIRK
ncbi:MAG: class I SAM-dependent methyltransferase [Euryarchaeota archaeon]|nr:class I SAM-dependent methyltransferase [Euryarchaeota archaeon]